MDHFPIPDNYGMFMTMLSEHQVMRSVKMKVTAEEGSTSIEVLWKVSAVLTSALFHVMHLKEPFG